MTEKVVSIIADSLALPRHRKDGDTPYDKTYPWLLRKALGTEGFHFVEAGKRSRTILDVIADYDELVTLRRSRMLIAHVGLVDCAPRVFTPTERAFVSKLPWIVRAPLLKVIKHMRPWFIDINKVTQWVPADQFRESCQNLITMARNDGLSKILFISILQVNDLLESRSPGFSRCVNEHNAIILSLATSDGFVEVLDINPLIEAHGGNAALTVDGMHLNNEGHRLLTEQLIPIIQKI